MPWLPYVALEGEPTVGYLPKRRDGFLHRLGTGIDLIAKQPPRFVPPVARFAQ